MNQILDETDIAVGTTIYVPVKGARQRTGRLVEAGDLGVLATAIYRKDDSLWSLAKKHYGNPRLWPLIADANGIPDETDIPVGTLIHIPIRKAKRFRPGITDTNNVSDESSTPGNVPIHTSVGNTKRVAKKLLNELDQGKPAEMPYILVGVVGSEKELKALIRDEEKENSYYVSEGDTIGEAKIIRILNSHVILSYAGKRVKAHFGDRLPSGSGISFRGQRVSSSPSSKVETDQEELERHLERWRAMDKDTRRMFYNHVRKRGFELADVLRDMELHARMMEGFHSEAVNKVNGREF
jgi:hypothetical protein